MSCKQKRTTVIHLYINSKTFFLNFYVRYSYVVLLIITFYGLFVISYINIYKCHKVKIDFFLLSIFLLILASNNQVSIDDKCWKTKCLYIFMCVSVALKFATTDHPVIVKVMMAITIKPDVSTFSFRQSCYMSNDN